jgi:hypothetical protein
MMAIVVTWCLTIHVSSLFADDPPPSETTTEAGATALEQRVILRVNRNLTVHGVVELEDDDVIVVRTLRNEVRSFSKSRVLQIVRLVDPEPEQRGIVYLLNGQHREGIIVEDTFEHVLMVINGIQARLNREFVDFVVLEPTFEQQYEEFRANLQPNMYAQHLQLCRWLIEQRRYELAKENLQEILAAEEIHEARRLLALVNAQLELIASRHRDANLPINEPETVSDGPKRVAAPILTHDDVNLMRVYEIDFDNPPRLTVQPETVRKLFRDYGTNQLIPATQAERNAMIRGDAARIVRLMFELRARELYPEVQVNSEPHAMNMFRLRVHNTWLLNNCATSGCHAGPDAGAFQLHRRGYADDRVRYTNFLILERLDVDPQWPLINYDEPEMSLILQYGLPRDAARLPHPDVRGWSPVFARPNDRMYQDSIRWIRSMMQPRPEYPIEFDPTPRWIEPEQPETTSSE